MNHIVKISEADYITHDVRRFRLEKPAGFSFIPGQAADVSINLPDWQEEKRPFTFTCLRDRPYLEFMIKIYPRKGVTQQLGQLTKGNELILHDVFGTIHYKGPGIFIAGGAGITPFISILRDLHQKNELAGNKLIFSNKTSKDVILENELTQMMNSDFLKVFTSEKVNGHPKGRIDKTFLSKYVGDVSQNFYVCGPDEFVKSIREYLGELGVNSQAVVIEK